MKGYWEEINSQAKQVEDAKRITEEILKPLDKKILDSGERRDFGTGAVRDAGIGKGRFDLCPLDVIGDLITVWDSVIPEELNVKTIFKRLNNFMMYGDEKYLFEVLVNLSAMFNKDKPADRNGIYNLIFEFAKHTEEGCLKYSDKDPSGKIAPNMMRGIPVHCYIDSGVRHLLKYLSGWNDEPHDRATIWNFMMAIWTTRHIPELNDINYEVYAGKGLKKND